MDAMTYIQQTRETYLQYYRRVVAEHAAKYPRCYAEVRVQPNGPNGPDASRDPMCFDILVIDGDQHQPIMVQGNRAAEGPAQATLRVGRVEATLHPFAWDACFVWFRHTEPDRDALRRWFNKWIGAEGTHPPGEDGLAGVVHFMGEIVREGGGFLCEVDFGSAPADALLELLQVLEAMGAAEITLGRSDGSDLDPDIRDVLQRPELTQTALTHVVAKLLRDMDGVTSVEITGESELHVQTGDKDQPAIVYTGNLYRRLLRLGPEARIPEMARYIRGQREMAFDLQVGHDKPDLSQLRPVIKDQGFLDAVKAQTDGKTLIVAEPLVGDLWVLYVWDRPNGMQFLPASEPAEYGLSLPELRTRAIANYCHAHPPAETIADGPLIVARTHDCYEASLLLDNAFWEQWEQSCTGAVLACVPARDVLLIADGGVAGSVAAMRHAARNIEAGGDHLISQTILHRRDKSWHVYVEPPAPARAPAASTPPAPAPPTPWWKFW